MSSRSGARLVPAVARERARLAISALAVACLTCTVEAQVPEPDEAHSSLSIAYQRLAVHERPNDHQARLDLALATYETGQLAEARATLAPLLGLEGSAGRRARALAAAVERCSWLAIPEQHALARTQARARYLAALRQLREAELSLAELEQLARRWLEAGELDASADLLVRIALRGPGKVQPQRVAAAVEALLGGGRPLDAALLHERAAERSDAPQDLVHALAALELARSAARPEEAWALFERLRRRFGREPKLLAAGLSAADDRPDSASARALIEELLRLEPDAPVWHTQMMRRALWGGDSARALLEQSWLAARGVVVKDAPDPREAARALSDLRLLANLQARDARLGPLPATELLDQLAVKEALGEPELAHSLLVARIEGGQGDDQQLWARRVALELALGRLAAAADSLRSMDERFGPSSARREQRVALLLQLGRSSEALALLDPLLDSGDSRAVSRLAALAWSLGDLERAQAAHLRLAASARASEEETLRLCTLQRLAGQERELLRTAVAGFSRFGSAALFDSASAAALQLRAFPQLEQLFSMAEAKGAPFTKQERYLALRASYHHGLASAARGRGELVEARAQLQSARSVLVRAADPVASSSRSALGALERAQARAELELALATDDRSGVSSAYARIGSELNPRERVFVLHQLRRDDEAVLEARRGLEDAALGPADRAAVARDGEQLARSLPRGVRAEGGYGGMGSLDLPRARLDFAYSGAWRSLLAGVEYTELRLAERAPLELDPIHELRPWLAGRWLRSHSQLQLELGVDVRDGANVRPYAVLSDALQFGSRGHALTLLTAFNEVPNSSPGLRVVGAQDQLLFRGVVPLSERFYASAAAQGMLWSTRDRELLGGGMNLDAALALHVLPAEQRWRWDLRLAGRFAPRYARADLPASVPGQAAQAAALGEWLIPASSAWFGPGLTLAYGELEAPPLAGRRAGLLADGAVGWLVPQSQLGYYAEGGVGVAPLGADLLAVKAQVGNVLGTAPGTMTWLAGVSYHHSLW